MDCHQYVGSQLGGGRTAHEIHDQGSAAMDILGLIEYLAGGACEWIAQFIAVSRRHPIKATMALMPLSLVVYATIGVWVYHLGRAEDGFFMAMKKGGEMGIAVWAILMAVGLLCLAALAIYNNDGLIKQGFDNKRRQDQNRRWTDELNRARRIRRSR
jgi:hypothetical protein